MNLTQFLAHWGISDNPFRGEEARHDGVFARMSNAPDAVHSDFEKILGQVAHPASAVVFGEKGSGKTAIRLQIAQSVARHNAVQPSERILLLPYDDLNRFLDHLHGRSGSKSIEATLKSIRLNDHLDAILSLAIGRIARGLLGESDEESAGEFDADSIRAARRLDRAQRIDLLIAQAVYDTNGRAASRTSQLRRALRLGPPRSRWLWTALAAFGWALPAGVLIAWFGLAAAWTLPWTLGMSAALALWAVVLFKRIVLDRARVRRLARRIGRHVRFVPRTEASRIESLSRLDPRELSAAALPVNDSDQPRYATLETLRRCLEPLGVAGLLVVIDRVDEPTLISGDAERMRSLVWPLLNNKLLQLDGVGIKMLLPLELRYALFRESSAFFQEARLDKQSLIERLSWTGPMLYDLCNARIVACLREGASPVSLIDLFEESLTRQELVDALELMQQPRDAFKLLYRCLTDHCAGVTGEHDAWRIPRSVFEHARRAEAERLQQLYRGIRPA
ncbi:MAG: hypothetical protein H6811_06110 [Phycisphaeraceae bacterium]|nr:hypothetical protein [Phycisphaeraceae bacterium]